MFVHPYHFRLMRAHFRKKVKGCHRIPLTCADRVSLVADLKLIISENYILKVLSESDRFTHNHSQTVLNDLIRNMGHRDWNEFLRKNPVPEKLYCNLPGRKPKNLINDLVEQRMRELAEPGANGPEIKNSPYPHVE